MIVAHDRHHFLQQLLVAEVIARRGEGPLARKRWPPPRRGGGPGAALVDPAGAAAAAGAVDIPGTEPR